MYAVGMRKTLFSMLLCSFLNIPAHAADCSSDSKKGKCPGEITTGQPRIWKYERVYPLLDGMLRDIEAMRLRSMTDLDPNQVNDVAVSILQTLLRVSASYDQSIGVNNEDVRQNKTITRLDAAQKRDAETRAQTEWDTTHESLIKDKLALEAELRDAQTARSKALDASLANAGTASETATATAYTAAKARVDDVSTRLKEKNDQIAAQGARPSLTAPTGPGSYTAGDASSLLSSTVLNSGSLASGLEDLPKDLKDKLISQAAKEPTLPATKQMDNQVTLLYERLSRQLALLNDDASRDSRKIYLLGFDVGLTPTKAERNKLARVQYTLSGCGGDVRAIQLYPAMSAYNVASFKAETHAWVLAGVFKSLIGLGVSADYQRLREEVRSGMTQAVYTSAFGAGTNKFGFYFGPAPSDTTVTPGEHSVFAFVSVPESSCTLADVHLKSDTRWEERNGRWVAASSLPDTSLKLPGDSGAFSIESIDYDPVVYTDNAPTSATVAIRLRKDLDPDTIITVGGSALLRVRDWRGRATNPNLDSEYFASNAQGGLGAQSFIRGLLETDKLQPGSWMAVNSRTLILNLKPDINAREFPSILLSAGGSMRDISDLVNVKADSVHNIAENSVERVRVGEFIYRPSQAAVGRNVFLPIAYKKPDTRTLRVSLWEKPAQNGLFSEPQKLTKLRIEVLPTGIPSIGKVTEEKIELPTNSQVIMVDRVNEKKEPVTMWPLKCIAVDKGLVCDLPLAATMPEAVRSTLTSVTIRVIAPGVVDESKDYDLNQRRAAPYFSSQDVQLDQAGRQWKLTLKKANPVPDEQLLLKISGNMLPSSLLSPSYRPESYLFDIPFSMFSSLGNSTPLFSRIHGSDAQVGGIQNLPSALMPQFSGWNMENQHLFLYGAQMSSIAELQIGGEPVQGARIDNESIQLSLVREGLLTYSIGDPNAPRLALVYTPTRTRLRIRKVTKDGHESYELVGQEAEQSAASPEPKGGGIEKASNGTQYTATATVSIDGKVAAESKLTNENSPTRAITGSTGTTGSKTPTQRPAAPPAAADSTSGASVLPPVTPSASEAVPTSRNYQLLLKDLQNGIIRKSGKTSAGEDVTAPTIQNVPPS